MASPQTSFVRARVGGLPRPFWALWSGTLVNRIGTMVIPFTGVYLTQARGLSVAAAGVVMAVYGAGSLFSQPLAGMLADRVGRRITLTGGMAATSAAMIWLGHSTSLPMIMTAMFALGLVIDAYRPASSALVADLVSPAERPRAFALLFWAVNLGFSVAVTAGGRLAELGFHWLFWINAATSLGFAVLVWRAVPETRPERGESAGGGFGAVFRDRVMVAFTLVVLGNAIMYSQTVTMLPVAMTRIVGVGDFGLAMAVNGVLIVVMQPLVAGWLGRLDGPVTMAAGLAVMAVGFAMTAFVTDLGSLMASVAVWTLGEIATAGTAAAIVAALAPPALRGRYSGVFGLAWSASTVLAPLLGGALGVTGGALWFVLGAVGLASAAALLVLGPSIRRRSRAALT
ncbi:MFS transporter [Nonomuraea longicatena]